jgi:hypothetical protein
MEVFGFNTNERLSYLARISQRHGARERETGIADRLARRGLQDPLQRRDQG